MKFRAIILLLCASALPATALAQAGEDPLLNTKWSLKQPRKKAKLAQAPDVEGPKVPPPQRLKLPRQKKISAPVQQTNRNAPTNTQVLNQMGRNHGRRSN